MQSARDLFLQDQVESTAQIFYQVHKSVYPKHATIWGTFNTFNLFLAWTDQAAIHPDKPLSLRETPIFNIPYTPTLLCIGTFKGALHNQCFIYSDVMLTAIKVQYFEDEETYLRSQPSTNMNIYRHLHQDLSLQLQKLH